MLSDARTFVVYIQYISSAAIEVANPDAMPSFGQAHITTMPFYPVAAIIIDLQLLIEVQLAAIIRCCIELIVAIFLNVYISAKYYGKVILPVNFVKSK